MCPQFNSTKQTQGTYKQWGTIWEAQLHLHLMGVPNLLWGSIQLLLLRTWLCADHVLRTVREVKQRRGRTQRIYICVLSSRLFGLAQFVKCGQFFFFLLELNSLGLYRGSKGERKIRCRMFTSSIKPRIRRFDVLVGQWTSKKCTKKHDARAELLFC